MVVKLKYGNTNTFFIKGENGNVLIDTDYAGTITRFYKEIKRNNISIKDINYIIATHYHPDHIGLISELMKVGIKLIIVNVQVPYIDFSNSIFAKDNLRYSPININDAIIIKLEESKEFLKEIGINGQIVHTPSHSLDSISLVLDNGECFVGDLEPIEYLNGYENNIELKRDWDNILSFQPKIIYYSHIYEKFIK